jgi:hypothetical protein
MIHNLTDSAFVTFRKAPVTAARDPVNSGEESSLARPDSSEIPEEKEWTFLHYGAGDNDLADFISKNVDQMESAGSDSHTNLVSQLDLPDQSCKRYYLTRDNRHRVITSPVVQDLGSGVNMADPKVLTDFIVWGMTRYPSKHVALVIGDHGGGTDGAIVDVSDGGKRMMKPPDIGSALRNAEAVTGRKLDVIGFDCCLMANTEVAYELRDCAQYMVASEESESGYGWAYNNFLSERILNDVQTALNNRINVGPKDFARKIVDDSEGVEDDLPTMSAIDLSKMQDLARSIDNLAQAVLDTSVPMGELERISTETQHFAGLGDIHDFARRISISDAIHDKALKASAADVMIRVKDAIIAERHSEEYPFANGLQIEQRGDDASAHAYRELAFARDTKWDESLKRIAGNK